MSLGCIEQPKVSAPIEVKEPIKAVSLPLATGTPTSEEIKNALGDVTCVPINESQISIKIVGWQVTSNSGNLRFTTRINNFIDLENAKNITSWAWEEIEYLKSKGLINAKADANSMTTNVISNGSSITGNIVSGEYRTYSQVLYVSHPTEGYDDSFEFYQAVGNNITIERQILCEPQGSRYRALYICSREEISDQTIGEFNSYLEQQGLKLRF